MSALEDKEDGEKLFHMYINIYMYIPARVGQSGDTRNPVIQRVLEHFCYRMDDLFLNPI